MAGRAPPVDQAAQFFEQPRDAMDLVDDDQPAGKGFKEGFGIGEACKVGGSLKIKVDRLRPAGRDGLGERRLADLPWP